ncbi:hypothetical protein SDJN03_18677, partial [Cucurbita argyrosperma subsp. sororia]
MQRKWNCEMRRGAARPTISKGEDRGRLSLAFRLTDFLLRIELLNNSISIKHLQLCLRLCLQFQKVKGKGRRVSDMKPSLGRRGLRLSLEKLLRSEEAVSPSLRGKRVQPRDRPVGRGVKAVG